MRLFIKGFEGILVILSVHDEIHAMKSQVLRGLGNSSSSNAVLVALLSRSCRSKG